MNDTDITIYKGIYDNLNLANILHNPFLASLLIPVISGLVTSCSTKILNFFLYSISVIFHLIYFCIDYVKYKIIKLYKLEYNAILIHLSTHDYKNNDVSEQHANPLIWYINTHCDLQLTQMISHEPHTKDIDFRPIMMSGMGGKYPEDNSTRIKVTKHKYLPLPINNSSPSTVADVFKDIFQEQTEFRMHKDKELKTEYANTIKFTVLNKNCFLIAPEIYGEFMTSQRAQTDIYNRTDVNISTSLVLRSKKSMADIQRFIDGVSKQYTQHVIDTQNYDNVILMYTGIKADKYETSFKNLSYDEFKIDKSQTFDNLFFSKKQQIKTLADKLSNIEYYQTKGLKRKISALFIGSSGTGKTATVVALANYLNRVIIYVPINRIDNDGIIEKILYSESYNDYIIPNHKKIFLFDEIDSFDNKMSMKKVDSDRTDLQNGSFIDKDVPFGAAMEFFGMGNIGSDKGKKPVTKNNNIIVTDKSQLPEIEKLINGDSKEDDVSRSFNIGTFLNLLDGTHDQDGMIIIATANHIERLDTSLYRTGRLTKIDFEYMGQNEIKEMIEKYYSIRLTDEEINRIRDDKTIQNLELKNVCITCLEQDVPLDQLIEEINRL